MFKKGQLVKSYKYGSCYIVRGYYDDSNINISPVSEPERIVRCFVDRLFLIGNNYQPFDDPRARAARKAKGG